MGSRLRYQLWSYVSGAPGSSINNVGSHEGQFRTLWPLFNKPYLSSSHSLGAPTGQTCSQAVAEAKLHR